MKPFTPGIFNNVLVFPILNILVLFYTIFVFLKLPGPLGFAIIALTILLRILLHPFFSSQMESAKKMQELKPQLDKLSEKYKSDRQRLQKEQLRLYQQAGVNPASGCLFLIIQIPIFIGLFNTLNILLTNGTTSSAVAAINKVLYFQFLHLKSIDPWFLGFNLALTPQKAGQLHYFIIPVLTGLLQYYQTKVSMPQVANQNTSAKEQGDFQKAMNTQMKYVFPILLAWFSYSLPVGLSLYWNIFSLFSIIQYRARLKTKP